MLEFLLGQYCSSDDPAIIEPESLTYREQWLLFLKFYSENILGKTSHWISF